METAHAVPAADAWMESGARQRWIARRNASRNASNLFFLQHLPLAPPQPAGRQQPLH